MTIPKLLEILQPYAAFDVPVEVSVWDENDQHDKNVDIDRIEIVLDKDGQLSHVVLGV